MDFSLYFPSIFLKFIQRFLALLTPFSAVVSYQEIEDLMIEGRGRNWPGLWGAFAHFFFITPPPPPRSFLLLLFPYFFPDPDLVALSSDQGCGSVSGSGSAWIRINLSCWIWIRIQEGKNDPQKKKKVKKFHVLNCWMFSFEG
jgi:hypothetical protein